jgi:hypothetical protein
MLIVASAFEIHAKPYALDRRRIVASRLKLLQFVAFRPWLMPIIRDWSETRGYAQQSILSPHQLRRGFLGDKMHDDVVAFLVARGVFDWMGSHLVSGVEADVLERLHLTAVEDGLFSASLRVLGEFNDITITNDMLEGW